MYQQYEASNYVLGDEGFCNKEGEDREKGEKGWEKGDHRRK